MERPFDFIGTFCLSIYVLCFARHFISFACGNLTYRCEIKKNLKTSKSYEYKKNCVRLCLIEEKKPKL